MGVPAIRFNPACHPDTASAAQAVPQEIPDLINDAKACIARQGRQKSRYFRLWKRGVESTARSFPSDVPWLGHVWKRARLYSVPQEIQAKGEAVENGKSACKEQVDAALQFV